MFLHLQCKGLTKLTVKCFLLAGIMNAVAKLLGPLKADVKLAICDYKIVNHEYD